MPAVQRIFKVDRREIERDLALLIVTGDTNLIAAIKVFCDRYSIALDAANISELEEEYKLVRDALKSASKKT
jgi:hypothetical protein